MGDEKQDKMLQLLVIISKQLSLVGSAILMNVPENSDSFPYTATENSFMEKLDDERNDLVGGNK